MGGAGGGVMTEPASSATALRSAGEAEIIPESSSAGALREMPDANGLRFMASMTVGAANDPAEREAEATSNRVVGGGMAPEIGSRASSRLGRALRPVRRMEEDEQAQCMEEEQGQALRTDDPHQSMRTNDDRREADDDGAQLDARRTAEETPARRTAEESQAVRTEDEAPVERTENDGQARCKDSSSAALALLRRQTDNAQSQVAGRKNRIRRQEGEEGGAEPWPEPAEGEVEALEAAGVTDSEGASEAGGEGGGDAGGGGGGDQAQMLRREEGENGDSPTGERRFRQREESVQAQEADAQEKPMGPEGGEVEDGSLAARMQSPDQGRPLGDAVRGRMEKSFDADFSAVRIHDTPQDRKDTAALGARAVAMGGDVWLGRGESESDSKLMAHELTHVVQQGGASQGKAKREEAEKSRAEATPQPEGGRRVLRRLSLRGKIASWAHNVPGYTLLTVVLGYDPIAGKGVDRSATNLVGGILGLVPGGNKLFENLKKSGALERAFTWLSAEFAKLNLTWASIKSLFAQAWEAASIWSPVDSWHRIKAVFTAPIKRLWNFAKAVGGKILEFIFEGVLTLAGPLGARVMDVIRKAGAAIGKIFSDPVGFLKNLLNAVIKGIRQFSTNIWTHLKSGLMGWLFGTLSSAGLKLPEKFDLKGILSLALQIMGITYARIRAKLVKVIGEKRVAFIEKAVEVVKILVTQGVAGVWKKLLEWIGNLKDIVLGAIQNWVVTKIVVAAVTKLASMFNPVGAVVQAIITIYNVIKFFIERIQQIVALVESVVNSVSNIAYGKLSAAANYIEQTMARTLPVIISFLANLLGLGGLAEKIKGIIKGIQTKVDKAIEKLIGWIVKKAKALWAKMKSAAKKGAEKVLAWWKVKKSYTSKDGTNHTAEVTMQGKQAVVMVRSEPKTLAELAEEFDALPDEQRSAAGAGKGSLKAKADSIQALVDSNPTDAAGMEAKKQQVAQELDAIIMILGKAGLPKGLDDTKTKVSWVEKQGRAHVVIADPLTKNPGNTAGQAASGALKHVDKWEFAVKKQSTKRSAESFRHLRGMHLLNADFHGPVTNWNIADGDALINNNMSGGAEAPAKEALDREPTKSQGGAPLTWKATATYWNNTEPSADVAKIKDPPNNVGDDELYEARKRVAGFYFAKSVQVVWTETQANGKPTTHTPPPFESKQLPELIPAGEKRDPTKKERALMAYADVAKLGKRLPGYKGVAASIGLDNQFVLGVTKDTAYFLKEGNLTKPTEKLISEWGPGGTERGKFSP